MPLEEFDLPDLKSIKSAKKLVLDFKKTIRVANKEVKPLQSSQAFDKNKTFLELLDLPDLKKLKK